MTSNDLLESLNKQGYVLIRNVLSRSELIILRAACDRAISRARCGKWPHVRTLPKQFPPWPQDPEEITSRGIWGVQHLLHLPESGVFALSYFSNMIIQPVKQLLECEEDELVMELYNLLCRPESDFALRWHRDDIAADATAEQELERLSKPAWHAQWNLALWDDESLIAVPGSHLRARTQEERETDPFGEMPGQQIVKMAAGDLVFYNNNILHRGVYRSSVERMTLHGSIGHVRGEKERARNVLQHGVGSWVGDVDFSALPEPMNERAEGMRMRLFEMGQAASTNVGFSHED